MDKIIRSVGLVTLVIVLIGVLFGLAWGNSAIIHQNPVEKKFLVPWLGLKNYLALEVDPYSISAAQNAQDLFYGRQAGKNEDPLYLGQPFTSVVLYSPFSLIGDYTIARVVWMMLLEVALIVSSFLTMSLFEWKPPIWLMIFFSLTAILGAQAFLPLLENSNAILIVFCTLLGLFFLKKGRDEVAGAFLVLSFFRPSATAIFCLVVIYWVVKNNHWRVIWGMLMTLGFLIITSFAILPGWLLPFIRSFRAELPFQMYLSTYKVFTNLIPSIGTKVAALITIGVVGILFLELKSKYTVDFRWFIWVVMLCLPLNSLLGIPSNESNNIFLFAPVTLVIKILSDRLSLHNKWLYTGIFLGILFFICWGIAFFGPNQINMLTFDLVSFIIPSIITTLGLYWIRWWIFHLPLTGRL